MLYCTYVVVCETREFSFSGAVCQKFLFSRRFMFSAFAAIPFGICLVKTCKLEREELCLYLCLNIRYMGCPKRPGQ
jgi:hypothetical protein